MAMNLEIPALAEQKPESIKRDMLAESMYEEMKTFGSGPLLEEMPRSSLKDKGISGSTAAHRIEEIHTPLNLAYVTFTTGTSAFQNIVGVTFQELPDRVEAGKRALRQAGIRRGDRILITYPPLVNVFSRRVFKEYGVEYFFLERPSRDALLVALLREQPAAVLGESTFLRAGLVDARRLGLFKQLPQNLIIVAAGSPLDGELEEEASRLLGAQVHDLYGCQEFGWLTLDGWPLRDDLLLWDSGRRDKRKHLIVGGIATGDCFLCRPCSKDYLARKENREETGRLLVDEIIITPSRMRAEIEPETLVAAVSTASQTAVRAARSILRIKGKLVRTMGEMCCGQENTVLFLNIPEVNGQLRIEGPDKTRLFDVLLEAQKNYEREAKADPVWNKKWENM